MSLPDDASSAHDVIARVHREDHSRLLARLVRRFGDLDLAEDAAQEAMESALRSWPDGGVPAAPLAWLTTTAQRSALDRIRRDATYARKLAEIHVREAGSTVPGADAEPTTVGDLPDDRLAMLMACCHPAIAPADRVALMLRFVAAFSSSEVAQALLLPLPTVQARITRAKRRIAVNRIPLSVPNDPVERARRVPLVLTAVSLIFTEGYTATRGQAPIRRELVAEAIRLARIVHRLLPDDAETGGLLGLLLLTHARTPARLDDQGVPVPLEDQDRSRWNQDLLTEGLRVVQRSAALPDAGSFTVQAAIAAVHAEAPDFDATDWPQIVALYDLLLARGDDPVVRMNRAIAVGRRDGPAVGRRLLLELRDEPRLDRHHPFHVALAMLGEETGDVAQARRHWSRALDLSTNDGERLFIRRRLDSLSTDA